jgi:spoIIIJ-associated protein
MPWITKEGRTVEEARDAAVSASGHDAENLDIEVVSEGAKGLFGLGGEPAIVRVRPRDEAEDVRAAFRDDISPVRDGVAYEATTEAITRPEPEPADKPADVPDEETQPEEKMPLSEQQEEAARIGVEIVSGILERMGMQGDINMRVAGGTVYIEVFGDEMGILIGRGGATLEALQEIVRAGVQRRLHTRQAIVVDIEAYWERRRKGRGRQDGNRRGGSERRGGNERRGGRRGEPQGNR